MDAGYEEQEGQHGELRKTSVGLERLKWKKSSRLSARQLRFRFVSLSLLFPMEFSIVECEWLDPKD